MKKYRQLTYEDRVYIDILNFQRRSRREIAETLRVSRSTISREFHRGCSSKGGWGHCYRAEIAEKAKRSASARRGRPPKIYGDLEKYVIEKLKLKWSPEQISGRLKLDGIEKISHETIYGFIKRDREQGGQLYLNLRHGRRRRKKRFSIPRVRADILNRKKIEDRPEVINKRERIGDWERDLMFGDSRSSALLTFVERKSLYTKIRKVQSKSPKEIACKTIELMLTTDLPCLSITNDNGFEFREHQQESAALNTPIYFANPYSSWEKGTCENINGLIRQYFPKRSPTKELTDETIKEIEEALNTRPRKKLGFRTPEEFITL